MWYWPLAVDKPILGSVPRAGGLMDCVQLGRYSSPEQEDCSAVHTALGTMRTEGARQQCLAQGGYEEDAVTVRGMANRASGRGQM